MVAYRLRIELPDRPGALAGVTGEIAGSGANIVSIDVHEVDGGTAIDEIVVEVPDDWAPGALAAALALSGAGNLLTSRAVVASEDPVSGALEAVVAMIAGDPDACCRALRALAPGSSARLVDVADTAHAGGGPVVERTADGWLLTAPDDTQDPRTIALVTRPAEVRFSATEVSRITALLHIHRQAKTTTTPAGAGVVGRDRSS